MGISCALLMRRQYGGWQSLSYDQYLWEAQLVNFVVEVVEARPMIMVGNSIGGGLSVGAASSLGSKICQ
eukprot:10885207-Ditylum_brightwellii.AAC.1